MGKTLFEKIWEKHIVDKIPDGPEILYIDKHFIHEVTSPQAFNGLRERGIPVFRTANTVATEDHNVPTIDQDLPIREALSRKQVEKLEENCKEFGVELYPLGNDKQGIVHIIGPNLGITQPGMTIVCGDSHTSTHGAFGTIAFGIGTSEVEMVLATQCILQNRPKTMRINVNGELGRGVLSKDIILYIISQITASGATGYFVEYAGTTIDALSMEARMTICNMSIEMGARGGMIAPDQKTFDYVKGREFAPKSAEWDEKLAEWKQLYTDEDAVFDRELHFNAEDIEPMVTYGTNPGMGIPITGNIPLLKDIEDDSYRRGIEKALNYMDLKEGMKLNGMHVQNVFIGSCTNSRIEDFRLMAAVIKGRKKAPDIRVLIVPGSQRVLQQIREEGIEKIFEDAGFLIRQPGCSACLGMNEDKVPAGEYCVSTSNRNYEGRQGPGARTILASPITAAAVALTGKISDVRELLDGVTLPDYTN